MPISTSGEPSKPKFSKEQLDKALLETYDLMSRALLNTSFIVVGEAARCLFENRGLDCDSIDVVLERKDVTKEVVSMIKDWATTHVRDNGFECEMEGVPLRVLFVKGTYDYFTYPDQRLYGPEVYKIPNQFKRYWEERKTLI